MNVKTTQVISDVELLESFDLRLLYGRNSDYMTWTNMFVHTQPGLHSKLLYRNFQTLIAVTLGENKATPKIHNSESYLWSLMLMMEVESVILNF